MPVSYSKVMFTACSMAFLMGSLAMPSWSSTLLAYCEKRMFTIHGRHLPPARGLAGCEARHR